MTLSMAAVQLGYSTESEALSDTTMWAARLNTDALTGGTAGMLLLCLLARGMEEWMNRLTDRKTGACGSQRRGVTVHKKRIFNRNWETLTRWGWGIICQKQEGGEEQHFLLHGSLYKEVLSQNKTQTPSQTYTIFTWACFAMSPDF